MSHWGASEVIKGSQSRSRSPKGVSGCFTWYQGCFGESQRWFQGSTLRSQKRFRVSPSQRVHEDLRSVSGSLMKFQGLPRGSLDAPGSTLMSQEWGKWSYLSALLNQTITLVWVLSYCLILGNEKADLHSNGGAMEVDIYDRHIIYNAFFFKNSYLCGCVKGRHQQHPVLSRIRNCNSRLMCIHQSPTESKTDTH